MKNNKYYLESIESRTLLAGLDIGAIFAEAESSHDENQHAFKIKPTKSTASDLLMGIIHGIEAIPSVIQSLPAFYNEVSEKAVDLYHAIENSNSMKYDLNESMTTAGKQLIEKSGPVLSEKAVGLYHAIENSNSMKYDLNESMTTAGKQLIEKSGPVLSQAQDWFMNTAIPSTLDGLNTTTSVIANGIQFAEVNQVSFLNSVAAASSVSYDFSAQKLAAAYNQVSDSVAASYNDAVNSEFANSTSEAFKGYMNSVTAAYNDAVNSEFANSTSEAFKGYMNSVTAAYNDAVNSEFANSTSEAFKGCTNSIANWWNSTDTRTA